jgi:hypothetical protein
LNRCLLNSWLVVKEGQMSWMWRLDFLEAQEDQEDCDPPWVVVIPGRLQTKDASKMKK